MKIFFLSQLYGFSFGCKANADQRDLAIYSSMSSASSSAGRWVEPPVKPSVCHFSEFYNKGDYDSGCDREERRMKIVEDAVTNILNDFTNDLGVVLFPDVAEAKDNLKAHRSSLDYIREETQSAIHDIVLKYYSLVPKCVDFPDGEAKEAKSLELPYQFNNYNVIWGLFGPYMPSFGPRPFSSTPPLLGEVGEPVSGEPILIEPILGEPILIEPILGEPISGEPILIEPILGEPISGEPILIEPIAGEPVSGAFSPIESLNDFMFNDFYDLTDEDKSEEFEAINLNNFGDNESENFHEKKKFSKTKTSICEKLKSQTPDIVNRECKRPDIRLQCQYSCQICYIGTN